MYRYHFLITFICIICIAFLAPTAEAQTLNIDFGQQSSTSRIIQMLALLTVLSLAPSIFVMITSFTRIIVVFSFLRSALGLQTTPPNSVLVSLALFLTFFIMQPAFMKSYEQGIQPLMNNEITEEEAFEPIMRPYHDFMLSQARDEDIMLFLDIDGAEGIKDDGSNISYRVLIPAFMISELRRAFEIGFLIFIPFLVIDLMIASTLMAMGMMMLPPVLISMPFKLIFFVLIDGWHMIAGSLIRSFGGG